MLWKVRGRLRRLVDASIRAPRRLQHGARGRRGEARVRCDDARRRALAERPGATPSRRSARGTRTRPRRRAVLRRAAALPAATSDRGWARGAAARPARPLRAARRKSSDRSTSRGAGPRSSTPSSSTRQRCHATSRICSTAHANRVRRARALWRRLESSKACVDELEHERGGAVVAVAPRRATERDCSARTGVSRRRKNCDGSVCAQRRSRRCGASTEAILSSDSGWTTSLHTPQVEPNCNCNIPAGGQPKHDDEFQRRRRVTCSGSGSSSRRTPRTPA